MTVATTDPGALPTRQELALRAEGDVEVTVTAGDLGRLLGAMFPTPEQARVGREDQARGGLEALGRAMRLGAL